MVTQIIDTSASEQHVFSQKSSAASRLEPAQRKNLSLQVLTRIEPISHLAQNHGLSRKFLYQQAAKACDALDEAFACSTDDQKVLFYLPVTKDWIRQFVISQVLIGHSSFRAVIEILDTVFDYRDISIGTVHNIVSSAVREAKFINQTEPLSAICVGAHDEIYQLGKLAFFLENRATGCSTIRQKLERKIQRAKNKGQDQSLSKRLVFSMKDSLISPQQPPAELFFSAATYWQ